MKILIDIKHPAQLNLFKGIAKELRAEGWDVTISYLARGKLPNIIEAEYKGYRCVEVGKSFGTKWSIFWQGNMLRTWVFLKLIKKQRYNICIAASSAPLAFAGYISATPVIQFYDDPERKNINRVNAFFSSKIFFPPIVRETKKVGIFNCLKEWSYLSPLRFTPVANAFELYGLNKHEYIFIREVSNKSFNYYNQTDAIISTFASSINANAKVLLSLEDKSLSNKYPPHWILLKEPVANIHSLIFYSKLVVSSGDSMAREGAMLGVPSIYCGIRIMKANELLMKEGLLQHLPMQEAVEDINEYIAKPFDETRQETVRFNLKNKWVDMVDFMKTQINLYKKNS